MKRLFNSYFKDIISLTSFEDDKLGVEKII